MLEVKAALDSGEKDLFFIKTEKILRAAIENFLSTEENKLSRNELLVQLSEKTNPELQSEIRNIFEQCDQSRYGFENSDASLEELYENLQKTVQKLH